VLVRRLALKGAKWATRHVTVLKSAHSMVALLAMVTQSTIWNVMFSLAPRIVRSASGVHGRHVHRLVLSPY